MAAKCAILAGSVTSAILGLLFVHVASAVKERRESRENALEMDDAS
jgi:NhaA family Na+:H+ antiporter